MTENTTETAAEERLTDRDLLRRFVQDCDHAAFAEIVRRHQALVLGVCRRVIGHPADVDDAFQATFVALARRPRQIQKTRSLSSWLYTVAWRTSWRLIRKRRRNPVEQLSHHPLDEEGEPLDRIAAAQDCLVLDEELNRLPDRYRDVLVMTYFSGHTSQQIADNLGVSKGTIDGRLRQARNALRTRLARRGVALGTLTFAAGLSTGSTASASPALLQSTIELGCETLSGAGTGSATLNHLEPIIQAEAVMLPAKLLMSAVLCSSAVIGYVALASGPQDAEDPFGDSETQINAKTEPRDTPFRESGGRRAVAVADSGTVRAVTDPEQALQVVSNPAADKSAGSPLVDVSHDPPPAFPLWSADAKPVEKWMHQVLARPVGLLDYPGESPLSEILDQIVKDINATYGRSGENDFRMQLHVDTPELEINGIVSLADFTVRDVTLQGISVENALKLVFEKTEDPRLAWEIRDEVMVITTEAKLESDDSLCTRAYNVAHLQNLEIPDFQRSPVLRHSNMGGGGGYFAVPDQLVAPDASEKQTADEAEDESLPAPDQIKGSLAEVVKSMTATCCRWVSIDGEGGEALQIGDMLVVRQTPPGHREVVSVLTAVSSCLQASESE